MNRQNKGRSERTGESEIEMAGRVVAPSFRNPSFSHNESRPYSQAVVRGPRTVCNGALCE